MLCYTINKIPKRVTQTPILSARDANATQCNAKSRDRKDNIQLSLWRGEVMVQLLTVQSLIGKAQIVSSRKRYCMLFELDLVFFLLDVDLARFRCLGLRNNNAKNAVLQAGLDEILIDTLWEAEAAMEFTDRALGDPGLVFWLFGRLGDVFLALRGGDFGCGLFLGFVFDGWSFVGGGTFDPALRHRCSFKWFAGFEARLGTAFDYEGVRVGELDFDVLLVDARKFTVKLIAVAMLVHVELGGEGPDGGMTTNWAVKVGQALVEHAEERCEVSTEGVGVAWEERHVSCLNCCWSNGFCGRWYSSSNRSD